MESARTCGCICQSITAPPSMFGRRFEAKAKPNQVRVLISYSVYKKEDSSNAFFSSLSKDTLEQPFRRLFAQKHECTEFISFFLHLAMHSLVSIIFE